MILVRIALAGVVVALTAPPAGAEELSRRQRGDLALQARGILLKHCGECHGPNPERTLLTVLDHRQLTAPTNPVPFVAPGDAAKSQLLELIREGSMPPGGRERPTAEDITTLEAWVKEKAPSYPRAFDDRTTLDVMLADFEAQKEVDKPFLRYLSFAHLIRDGEPLPSIGSAERRLLVALTASSRMTKAPIPVDDTATLFRLDLRTVNWHTRDLFFKVEQKKVTRDVASFIPFDLILLEYPFGFTLPANDQKAADLTRFLDQTKQVRPVPYLRADWLTEALVKEEKGKVAQPLPLADDLKSLVELAAVLEANEKPAAGKEKDIPCGPKLLPFSGPAVTVPTKGPDGRTPLLPYTAWAAGDVRPEPAPFTLKAELVSPNGGSVLKTVKVGEAFQLRVTADRAVEFTLLMVWSNGTIVHQPVSGGTRLNAGETRLLEVNQNGGFKITDIPSGAKTGTEYFVLLASETSPPVPPLIQSRHSADLECGAKGLQPVRRFIPAPADAAARVVRVVVPIPLVQQ